MRRALLSLGFGLVALVAASGGVADGRTSPGQAGGAIDYTTAVQQIFNRHCIACHGCLGSPCNVKLDSFRGVERGGFRLNAYSAHFGDYPRTDMDAADSTAAWRKRVFYPILARDGTAKQNLDNSLLLRMVAAGMDNNSPGFDREALYGLRPARYTAVCSATPQALSAQLEPHPTVGIPFWLPAISDGEFATLNRGPIPAGALQHAAGA